MKNILQKMKLQWKTIKQGFRALNVTGRGYVSKQDLENMVSKWGVKLDEAKLQQLFESFDHDKDGQISFKDFQETIGMEITP